MQIMVHPETTPSAKMLKFCWNVICPVNRGDKKATVIISRPTAVQKSMRSSVFGCF